MPRLVGVRRLAVPEPLSADAVDLARRVAAVLGLLVTPERRAALLRGPSPRGSRTRGPRFAVPETLRPWVTERAERMRRQLRRGGYPVAEAAWTACSRPTRPAASSTSATTGCWVGDRPAAGRARRPEPGPETGPRCPARVLLHVGTPKTGTSYLQDVLLRNRETLAGHGICYPADRFDAHFLAALDLMRLPWGGLETEAVGAWDRLAAAVRACPGTAIISHEILATASRSQVGRALASLGADDGPTARRCTSCSRCATWCARSRPSGRRTSSTAAR